MEDEILENTPENNEILDTTDQNLGNNNEADTDVEEKKPFTVDDIEFTEEYNLGGYDFSKFKGRIDESSLPYIEEYAKRYQEQGFTQAQIEFLMEENLSETPKDRDSIMKELNTSLTMEEKQSYKYTGTQLRQALDKSNLGKYYDEIMTNPIAFKVVNALVKNMTPGANVGAKTERESRTSRLTGYQAVDKFNEYLRANIGNADVQGKVKELMAIIGTEEDKKYFKETLGL
ncbi:hypothetical protein CTM86_00035 [Fusobacterium pseudoperiodonticum]|uniref:Uncharacterized protein n=1 Tax=Fusobacterium pseudoperiodonticum TaxID=2663009 RepID=A0AAD0AS30_9FUSO|nr:hypothetical protein [Fusobacterium pseudoperiodonticum]ATV65106.1 hypothetical protein CTM86_00035 [Fusobacterium pseudoperiodonticum]